MSKELFYWLAGLGLISASMRRKSNPSLGKLRKERLEREAEKAEDEEKLKKEQEEEEAKIQRDPFRRKASLPRSESLRAKNKPLSPPKASNDSPKNPFLKEYEKSLLGSPSDPLFIGNEDEVINMMWAAIARNSIIVGDEASGGVIRLASLVQHNTDLAKGDGQVTLPESGAYVRIVGGGGYYEPSYKLVGLSAERRRLPRLAVFFTPPQRYSKGTSQSWGYLPSPETLEEAFPFTMFFVSNLTKCTPVFYPQFVIPVKGWSEKGRNKVSGLAYSDGLCEWSYEHLAGLISSLKSK